MKTFIRLLAIGLPLIFLSVQAPGAQERSAVTGNVNVDFDWSMLSSQVATAVNKSNDTNTKVQGVVVCNGKSMLYVPGASADVDGCIENSKIGILNSRVDTINAHILVMNNQINTINANLTSTQTRVTNLQGTLATISTQVNDLLTQYNDLSAKAALTMSQINALNTTATNLSSQVASLAAKFANHSAQITDEYNQLSAISTQISNFNTAVNNANSTTASLNSLVNALNSNTANVLYCGRSNYVFNRNVGCAQVVGHATCNFSCPTCLSITCQ